MTAVDRPQSPPVAPTSPAPAAAPSAFGALLLRDLTVLRKNLKEFIPRTLLQPLLLVFVFTYVFPKIGQGVGGGGAGAATFSTCSSPAWSPRRSCSRASRPSPCRWCRSSATPGRSRTACSRRCRSALVAFEKIVAGALQCLFAGAHRVPDRRDRAGHAGAPRTSTGRSCSRWSRSACLMAGALGLMFGTLFDPRTVPMLFGVDRDPDHVPRLHLLPVAGARADPLAADRRARQPARVHERGLPGRAHAGAAHVACGPSTRVLIGFAALFTWLGIKRLHQARHRLTVRSRLNHVSTERGVASPLTACCPRSERAPPSRPKGTRSVPPLGLPPPARACCLVSPSSSVDPRAQASRAALMRWSVRSMPLRMPSERCMKRPVEELLLARVGRVGEGLGERGDAVVLLPARSATWCKPSATNSKTGAGLAGGDLGGGGPLLERDRTQRRDVVPLEQRLPRPGR